MLEEIDRGTTDLSKLAENSVKSPTALPAASGSLAAFFMEGRFNRVILRGVSINNSYLSSGYLLGFDRGKYQFQT
jgi:hypothetical protein